MLVAGKDSFHKSFYNLMVEGNRSKTYNTNESQDETEDLIKGKERVVLMNVAEKEIKVEKKEEEKEEVGNGEEEKEEVGMVKRR